MCKYKGKIFSNTITIIAYWALLSLVHIKSMQVRNKNQIACYFINIYAFVPVHLR